MRASLICRSCIVSRCDVRTREDFLFVNDLWRLGMACLYGAYNGSTQSGSTEYAPGELLNAIKRKVKDKPLGFY